MKVKIKTWEQMKEEFGVDEDGFINCHSGFTPRMEKSMPEDRIVELVDGREYYVWVISEDMIEEVIEQ